MSAPRHDHVFRDVRSGQSLKLNGGAVGNYLGFDALTGKHRVQATNLLGYETTWLLDDDGKCRGDKAASTLDYIGGAA